MDTATMTEQELQAFRSSVNAEIADRAAKRVDDCLNLVLEWCESDESKAADLLQQMSTRLRERVRDRESEKATPTLTNDRLKEILREANKAMWHIG